MRHVRFSYTFFLPIWTCWTCWLKRTSSSWRTRIKCQMLGCFLSIRWANLLCQPMRTIFECSEGEIKERLPSALLLVRVFSSNTFHKLIGIVSIQKVSKYSNRSSSDSGWFAARNWNAGSTLSRGRRASAIICWHTERAFSSSLYIVDSPSFWIFRWMLWVKWKKHPICRPIGNFKKLRERERERET